MFCNKHIVREVKDNQNLRTSIIKFRSILGDRDLRITKKRENIFRTLSAHNRPISISTLIQSLESELDMVTVYRNIELFKEIGIVNKVYSGWKYRLELSEQFKPHHHHITCSNCQKIVPVEINEKLENDIAKLGKPSGFTINSHELELTGICKNCRRSVRKRQ